MDGTQAAQAVIDGLPEPRRSQMQHLHEVILDTLPGIDVRVTDYSGSLIGYGWYAYSNSKGPAGEWFTVGIANRKAYISLYAMGTRGDRNLVEAVADRFPGHQARPELPEHRQARARRRRRRPRPGP